MHIYIYFLREQLFISNCPTGDVMSMHSYRYEPMYRTFRCLFLSAHDVCSALYSIRQIESGVIFREGARTLVQQQFEILSGIADTGPLELFTWFNGGDSERQKILSRVSWCRDIQAAEDPRELCMASSKLSQRRVIVLARKISSIHIVFGMLHEVIRPTMRCQYFRWRNNALIWLAGWTMDACLTVILVAYGWFVVCASKSPNQDFSDAQIKTQLKLWQRSYATTLTG